MFGRIGETPGPGILGGKEGEILNSRFENLIDTGFSDFVFTYISLNKFYVLRICLLQ